MRGLNGLICAKQGRGGLHDYLAQLWRQHGGHEACQLSELDIKNADKLFAKEMPNRISPSKATVRHLKTIEKFKTL